MEWQIATLLGGFVGVILALTGAGGAILSVPLLMFFLPLSLPEAAPISLLAVSGSATVGAILGFREKIVRYRAAIIMACIGGLFTPLGLWLSVRLPHVVLMVVFSAVLVWVAVRMWQKANQHNSEPHDAINTHPKPCEINTATGRFIWNWPCARALMGAGALAGFLSGLLGVGGGFVIVPALSAVTHANIKAIVATSLLVIALVSAIGVGFSLWHGGLNVTIGLPFLGGALVGMLSGRLLAGLFSPRTLQKGFAILAFSVALSMMAKLIG